MTRRDRTTGMPKHRPRPVAQRERRFAGIPLRESYARWAILGGVVVLFLFVLGLVGYRWYDENIGKPREVILRVDDQSFSLRYFTDRMGNFWLSNQDLTRGFLEPALLTKLEEEAVTIQMARDEGIDLSDEAVMEYIAEDLGVEGGPSDEAFDARYRQRLRETGMRESDYRRLSRAALAEAALLERIAEDIGETGETLQIRTIITTSEEEAQSIVERIEDGEEMSEIAMSESEELPSREIDGTMPHTPRQLFPQGVRDALEDVEAGTLVEPVEVQNQWWVVRLEDINPEGELSETDQEQLAEVELEERINAARAEANIRRSLGDDQINWAYRNLDIPEVN